MGFSMNRPNMSISYGGESNKQQKSNLMKDNPVAKHASAMNMGKAHSKSPNYKYSDTPMELTAEGKKKILASDANPEFKKAIAKSPVNKNDPKKIAKLASVEQKPKGSTKGLNKKKTITPKPKAKTSHHMYGELKDKKTGKVIKTFGTKPGSPATKPGEPKRVKKAVRKAKKYIKAKESVKKQEEKGNYNSFREEGTKKAKRKVKKASKKHDKMRKAVDKLSTSDKKEALKKFKSSKK